jgi:hypothetical protein
MLSDSAGRIDGEIAGEGTAQCFIGGNQCPQALVDLPVFSLTSLLNRLHREQSDSDSDEGNHAQAQQGREQRRPGSEI